MGNVDLFHSRRVNYARCEYWVRDERDSVGSPEQWILANRASGNFYARPVSTKNTQMDVVSGVWAFDSDHVTLETDEDVDDISRGSVVRYADQLWIVESVQRFAHWKESEFSKRQDYRYVLAMARG